MKSRGRFRRDLNESRSERLASVSWFNEEDAPLFSLAHTQVLHARNLNQRYKQLLQI